MNRAIDGDQLLFLRTSSDQFDAALHTDDTHAPEPLEPWSLDEADLPETYPGAL